MSDLYRKMRDIGAVHVLQRSSKSEPRRAKISQKNLPGRSPKGGRPIGGPYNPFKTPLNPIKTFLKVALELLLDVLEIAPRYLLRIPSWVILKRGDCTLPGYGTQES